MLELCGIQTALQLFPVYRKARKFHPCIQASTYTSAHTICWAELLSLEELGNPGFSNPEKASKSRILPMASKAFWPVSTSSASALPPSPFLCALLAKHIGLMSAFQAAHTLSCLQALNRLFPLPGRLFPLPFPSLLLLILSVSV